jgi:hypothetical protein
MKIEYLTITKSFLNKLMLLWFYCGAILSFTIFSFVNQYELHISITLVIVTIISLSLAIFNSISIQIDKPIKIPDNIKPLQTPKSKKNFGYRPKQ